MRVQAPRRGRRQLQQLTDCSAGTAARSQLKHLAKQNERDDYRRCLEIDAYLPMFVPGRWRECAGKYSRDQAEEIRHAHAEGDEREHVQVPTAHRSNSTLV